MVKRAAEDKDQEALNGIFNIYDGLLNQIALKYRSSKLPFPDAYQLAAVGLMKAIRRYDPDRGTAFKSYAYPNIEGELKKFYRDDAEMIRLPRKMWKLKNTLKEAEQNHLSENGTPPTRSHLAETLGIEEKDLMEAKRLDNYISPLSIYRPASPEDSFQLESVLGCRDPRIEELEDVITLEQAVKELPGALREVFELRMKTGKTQAAVANKLGISQMQVSRMEKKACALIRSYLFERHSSPDTSN